MLLLPGEISHQNNNENVTEQIKVWGGEGGWPNRLHLDASQFRGSPLCAGLFTAPPQTREGGDGICGES